MPNIAQEVNVVTNKKIVPGVVDGVFKNDPLLAYLKSNGLNKISGGQIGGSMFQENFLYKPMIGGSYSPGATFDITKRRTLEGMNFDLRHHYVNVTEYQEHLDIYNRGPEAVFSLIEADLTNAALTMSAMLAIEVYNAGSGSGRTEKINGLAEALNDGTNNSWNAASYSTYGGVTRADVNSALNSKLTAVSGSITYAQLEQAYNDVTLGAIEPNLLVTTNRGMSYIKQKFHPQYRVTSQDPKIGFTGIQFNKAMILQSQYAPGAQGVNDADLGNYLDSDGETLWMLQTDYIKMYVTSSDTFGFGFSGFKWAQDSTTVAGQYFASVNIVVTAPRLMHQLHAITG